MSRTAYEQDQDDRRPRQAGEGGRILWGRVIILGLALALMFFLGRCTADGESADAQQIERLETRVDNLLEENRDLQEQVEALGAGGTETDEGDDGEADEGGDGSQEGDTDDTSDEGAEEDEGSGADDEEAQGASDTSDEEDSGDEQPRTHEVQRGESLYVLAERYYGDGNKFRVIARANGLRTNDPLQPGQTLEIPPDPDS